MEGEAAVDGVFDPSLVIRVPNSNDKTWTIEMEEGKGQPGVCEIFMQPSDRIAEPARITNQL